MLRGKRNVLRGAGRLAGSWRRGLRLQYLVSRVEDRELGPMGLLRQQLPVMDINRYLML